MKKVTAPVLVIDTEEHKNLRGYSVKQTSFQAEVARGKDEFDYAKSVTVGSQVGVVTRYEVDEDKGRLREIPSTQNSAIAQDVPNESAFEKPRPSTENAVNSQPKKSKWNETTQPNAQKCRYSPYSFHRFARCHKEKLKDGSITMILRCRYCIEFQQVIIRFVKQKGGRYLAEKTVMPVNETIQNG